MCVSKGIKNALLQCYYGNDEEEGQVKFQKQHPQNPMFN